MLEYLTKEDLPYELQSIAETVGIECIKELVRTSGGGNLYIPSQQNLLKPVRNRLIREKFRGDYKEISLMFGVGINQVRNIIKNG